jgi:hypothetical protein
MRYDYADIRAAHSRARRERAEAVYRYLVAPLARWFKTRMHASPRRSVHVQGRPA